MRAVLIAASFLALTLPASAHVDRHHHFHSIHRYADRSYTHVYPDATPHIGGLVTVQTAAGIAVTVAQAMAAPIQGFIAAIVAQGYRPHSIVCLASGHMPHSLHHVGRACDIDQRARDRTAPFMYHVTQIAAANGLTDGGIWRNPDHGHIQLGGGYASYARSRRVRYATR